MCYILKFNTDENDDNRKLDEIFRHKYLKYKRKYLQLKKLLVSKSIQ